MEFSWMKGLLLRGISLFFLLISPRASDGRKASSLFEFSEHVQELNSESFEGIAKSTQAWAINFYSPGCPHCTRFAPTWEKVGDLLAESSVKVGAVNCIKHSAFCKEREIHGYPSLVAFNYPGAPPGTAAKPALKVLKAGEKSLDKVMIEIKSAFPCLNEENLNASSPILPVRELEEERREKPGGISCMLQLEDAIMSIRFALKHDVFTDGLLLSDGRKDKVLSFLDLLATTFPGNNNRQDFRSLATGLRHDPSLNDMARWDSRIDNLKIGSFVPVKDFNWPAANIEKGTEEGTNHYTNGLWALFHVLSVSQAPSRQSPYEIMEGIYSFVANFFRCQMCREHFTGMYETCENDRCKILKQGSIRSQQPEQSQTALALWVWRTHNAVNTRLATEHAIDVNVILWPRAKACQDCWSGPPQDEGQPPWRETAVFYFLRKTYSCSAVEMPDLMGYESSARSWAITCIVVCTGVLLLLWARRWQEMRGVGLTKKLVDSAPSG